MTFSLFLIAIIMGVVEGLTEFLPISSTGHLILTAEALSFHGEFVPVFEIVIQSGAMLALCWEFRKKIWAMRDVGNKSSQTFILNILLAFLPAALLGVLLSHTIKSYLFSPAPVALAFIIGGLLIIWVEKNKSRQRIQLDRPITPHLALKIGCLQALALIPGVSRSGASIIGALWLGVSRTQATEFSFFLAIPTLFGASLYSIVEAFDLLNINHLPIFFTGFIAAFISALVCVRWLLRFIASHTFIPFAWYRIFFGGLIFLGYSLGFIHFAQK